MSISTYVTSKIERQTLSHTWKTTIQSDIEGGEKRSAIYTWPRVSLDNTLRSISTNERNFLRYMLFKNLHNIFGIPLVHDKTTLTAQAASGQKVLTVGATDYRHFYAGRGCILIDPSDWTSYEYGTITTVDSSTQITLSTNLTSTWATDTKVYPMYPFRVDALQEIAAKFRQLNYLKFTADESFEATRSFTYSLPASGAATYNGYDLFLYRPFYPLKTSFMHPYELLSFYGLSTPYSDYTTTRPGLKGSYTFVSRSEIQDVLNFFDSKKGRFSLFYMPSWGNDIVPAAAIASDATTITIEASYYLLADLVGKHLYIRLPDSSYVCREITNLPASTTLVIDSAIGTAISANDVSKMLVSFLNPVRFDVDELKLAYTADVITSTDLSFKVVW